ncbi:AGL100Wp [Eremothecium gossypii ATCC 10895]|uniref:Protein EBS1 n=1 Tax=Eremothecium gossypii (strain ATCC 10895 / CBS 109.51 / FGSC 9923 / NRRL Y-1056) TaxID=284811 RepID=EBS1_EREGS|nr:AGL100Wp [Eremothecium gossypii ATCC 10895]Q751B2.1 RecName: Full=Protein EBS1 [Eremothecium gossypii ATCC 10895]AAS54391.1 AGL100Wp [Eremothecium gossypii ATCC 10895]
MTLTPMEDKGIIPNFNDFKRQLAELLQSRSTVEDITLLQGFLQLVHSKTQQWRGAEGLPATPDLLDAVWKEIHYPIFKWFQQWRAHLLEAAEGGPQERTYISFRRMNGKLNKIFKIIRQFYNGLVQQLFDRYDFGKLLPAGVIRELNVQSGGELQTLDDSSYFTILCVMSLQRCLLYLGCCHRYKCCCSKLSKRFHISDFDDSMRYFMLAKQIVPSVGETYLQEGLVYVQTGNYGHAAYAFMRGSLSRMPTDAGIPNLESIVADASSGLFAKHQGILKRLRSKESDSNKLINREVLEFYFLALFSSVYAPESWSKQGSDIRHCTEILFEKVRSRYARNVRLILQDVLLFIGGFDLVIKKAKAMGLNRSDTLPSNCTAFLETAFDFFSHVIDSVVLKEWQSFDTWEYLALVRVICVWIKSHSIVTQFAHRHTQFCQSVAHLLNNILAHTEYQQLMDVEHRPKRDYFFQEDIMLKDFSAIGHTLSDFNDVDLFQMENLPDRLAGLVDDKLTAKEEGLLKLHAIVFIGKKFLANNDVNIVWCDESKRFNSLKPDVPLRTCSPPKAKTPPPSTSDYTPAGAKQTKKSKPKRNSRRVQSLSSLEAKLMERKGLRQSVAEGRVYSGCSVPAAPMSFDVAPSAHLYQDRAAGTSATQEAATYYNQGYNGPMQLGSTEILNSRSPSGNNRIAFHPSHQAYMQMIQTPQPQAWPTAYGHNAYYSQPTQHPYPMSSQLAQFQNGPIPFVAGPYAMYMPPPGPGMVVLNNGHPMIPNESPPQQHYP